MAYIGNARSLLIFAANVRDDIIPDGVNKSFLLSQEVPGGYEENIFVIRQKWIVEELVSNTSAVSILESPSRLYSNNNGVAAALSVVHPDLPGYQGSGHQIILSGSTQDGSYDVVSVNYNGSEITIELTGNLSAESPTNLTISTGYLGFWEILEPEVDYTISGVGKEYNKRITFSDVPAIDDSIYVIHKGEATYNFVPSPNSVGPNQLSHNLRNFVCDRFRATAGQTVFHLSQDAITPKTLYVTVDGVFKDSDDPEYIDPNTGLPYVGEWTLDSTGKILTFHNGLSEGQLVRVLHLGFSTITRRWGFSPGHVGGLPYNSITNQHLQNNSVTENKIDAGAVTKDKIADNAIDGEKILLQNDQWLFALNASANEKGLLKLDTSNNLFLNGPNQISFGLNYINKLTLSDTQLLPVQDGAIDLGSNGNKWKSLFVAGSANIGGKVTAGTLEAGDTLINGDIEITGTIDNVDVSNLQIQVNNLITKVNNLLPVGMLMMWTSDTSIPTGWLLANGEAVSKTTYSELYAVIGDTFQNTGDPPLAPGTFRLPDLRQRIPMGKHSGSRPQSFPGTTGTILGNKGGNADHTHSGGSHTHGLNNHTHTIGGHYHDIDVNVGTTIAINSSGTHYTDLGHTHQGPISTQTGEGTHSNSFSLTASNSGDHTHSHSITMTGNESSPLHTHNITGGIYNTDTNHRHRSWDYGVWNGSASECNPFALNTNIGNTDAMPIYHNILPDHTHVIKRTRANMTINDSHEHTVETTSSSRGASYPASRGDANSINYIADDFLSNGSGNLSVIGSIWPWLSSWQDRNSSHSHSHNLGISGGTTHRHPITGDINSSGSHTHPVSGTITGGSHVHSISSIILSPTNSTSLGNHTHVTADFTGRIGNANTGYNGNSGGTSGPAAGFTASSSITTDANNQAFQVVHFIIKAIPTASL